MYTRANLHFEYFFGRLPETFADMPFINKATVRVRSHQEQRSAAQGSAVLSSTVQRVLGVHTQAEQRALYQTLWRSLWNMKEIVSTWARMICLHRRSTCIFHKYTVLFVYILLSYAVLTGIIHVLYSKQKSCNNQTSENYSAFHKLYEQIKIENMYI